MSELPDQQFGSIWDPHDFRIVSAEGIGLRIPVRDSAHADPDWYQLDKDDPIEDPDAEFTDPLPTQRHRSIP